MSYCFDSGEGRRSIIPSVHSLRIPKAIMPKRGTCRLCLKEEDLQDSHFFPASAYKLCRDAKSLKNPILLTDNTAAQSSLQMTAYLLCAACEDRFNVNGERWVHRNLATLERFPIQEAIAKANPIVSGPELAAYAGANIENIDVEKLVYFGLSIFWRAAVHRWTISETASPTKRIPLGPYEDPIRRFLVGEAGFPENTVLMITVWPYAEPRAPLGFHTPVSQNKGRFRIHQFYIHGLDFKLAIGKLMHESMRKMCTYNSPEKLIFASTKAAQQTVETYSKAIAGSTPQGKLAAQYPK